MIQLLFFLELGLYYNCKKGRKEGRVGGGWELRLGIRRSDPRERTGVGCVNTA